MLYSKSIQTIAFHGCDEDVAKKILLGEEDLEISNNSWDWLGEGVYFWEQNANRALDYANKCSSGEQIKNKETPIKKPFVLGAIIELGKCLDLTDSESVKYVDESYKSLLEALKVVDIKYHPENKGANRELDCVVINYLHRMEKEKNLPPFDTIRCAFNEGEPIYKGSNFTTHSHIQIAVINRNCIRGYFIPKGLRLRKVENKNIH